jgi:hypothetical protein
MPYLRKRSEHTLSKGRFLGAQMTAYLENGHWLDLAAAANGPCARSRAWAGEDPRSPGAARRMKFRGFAALRRRRAKSGGRDLLPVGIS